MKSEEAGSRKKPYLRPTVEALSLPAEEVLAAGCKLSTGGPPPTGLGCRLGGCYQQGS